VYRRAVPTLCALETTTARASLCLWRDGRCVFGDAFESDRRHHARLFAPLQRAVEILGDERLDAVVVGTGPGSYGGARVGIAAGQGLAMVHGCPAVGLSSLLAVGADRATAIGDARRGLAWHAVLDGFATPRPTLVPMAELAAALSGDRPVITFDDPAQFPLGPKLAPRRVHPTATRLAEAWSALGREARERLASVPPQPAYLAPPHITRAKPGHPLRRARRADDR